MEQEILEKLKIHQNIEDIKFLMTWVIMGIFTCAIILSRRK